MTEPPLVAEPLGPVDVIGRAFIAVSDRFETGGGPSTGSAVMPGLVPRLSGLDLGDRAHGLDSSGFPRVWSNRDSDRRPARRPSSSSCPHIVMPGLVPGIHAAAAMAPTEMPGTSPGMTEEGVRAQRAEAVRTRWREADRRHRARPKNSGPARPNDGTGQQWNKSGYDDVRAGMTAAPVLSLPKVPGAGLRDLPHPG